MPELGVQSLLVNQWKRAFSGEPKHFQRLLPCLRRRLHSFHFLCPLPWGQTHSFGASSQEAGGLGRVSEVQTALIRNGGQEEEEEDAPCAGKQHWSAHGPDTGTGDVLPDTGSGDVFPHLHSLSGFYWSSMAWLCSSSHSKINNLEFPKCIVSALRLNELILIIITMNIKWNINMQAFSCKFVFPFSVQQECTKSDIYRRQYTMFHGKILDVQQLSRSKGLYCL